jgi:hypothetical protein
VGKGNISEKHRETSNVSEFAIGNIFASGEANHVFATMFPRVGKNMETFEETSRITNVSATMFPSLLSALVPSSGMAKILIVTFVIIGGVASTLTPLDETRDLNPALFTTSNVT